VETFMPPNSTRNDARIIEGLLSLEAWHKPFEIGQPSPLHVALAFRESRYVGSDKLPVVFTVNLKKATLIVIGDENLTVPMATKVRSHPPRSIQIVNETGAESSRAAGQIANRNAAADLSFAGIGATVGNSRQTTTQTDESQQTRIETTQTMTQLIAMTYFSRGAEHHWDCSPLRGSTLQQNAHDGSSMLMELTPQHGSDLSLLGVKVIVRCNADDLEITDIEVKDTAQEVAGLDDLTIRLKVAKEVIRLKLIEAMLPSANPHKTYEELTLADLMAVPEQQV
jgi:hypothetical protein